MSIYNYQNYVINSVYHKYTFAVNEYLQMRLFSTIIYKKIKI